ncbi:MAG: thioredoxin family protein [Spirochaetales bacterium]|nr:thioredoxin family protein [Spirochaetales bacterium]
MKRRVQRLAGIALLLSSLHPQLSAGTPPFVEGTAVMEDIGGSITITVSAVFSFPQGYYQANDPEFFFISMDRPSSRLVSIEYPGGAQFRGATMVEAVFEITDDPTDQTETSLSVHYQLCDEAGTCYFPKSRRLALSFPALSDTASGGTAEAAFRIEVPDYPQFNTLDRGAVGFGPTETGGSGQEQDPAADPLVLPDNSSRAATSSITLGSAVFILFLALVGGILLNVMPCVLPVLSLKAMHLVQLHDKDRQASIRSGAVYSLGIITSLLSLGAAAAVLKGLGEISGWGFQFQNPYFTVSLSFLMFVFALSMFDVFIFNIPGLTFTGTASDTSGTLGTFLSGVLAVLLATPCTAPFMGSALGLAFTLGPGMIAATFAFVGIGLALPFFLLSVFPSLLAWIPKPGAWMNTFKQLLGFLLLGTLGWLLNSAYHQLGWKGMQVLFLFFLGTGLILMLFGNNQKRAGSPAGRRILLIIFAVIFIFGIYQAGSVQKTGESEIPAGWREFSEDTLEMERSSGKGVFIAFSAEWCLTCKTNESLVLSTDRVMQFFKENDISLLYGDYTNGDPVIASWIEGFGRSGVPVYAFYAPGKDKPVLLPEVLTPQSVFAALSANP